MAPRRKYYELSTGYKVETGREDTDSHLRNAILGECLTEVAKVTKGTAGLGLHRFNDHLVRRIYRECEYLSMRYDLVLWQMLGAMMERLGQAMEDLRNGLCEDCDDKDCCEERGQNPPPCNNGPSQLN